MVGLATISLAGAGVGIGDIFSGYIRAVGMNPKMQQKLFAYTVIGFALTEVIALFGLMMAFIIIYSQSIIISVNNNRVNIYHPYHAKVRKVFKKLMFFIIYKLNGLPKKSLLI